VCTHTRTHAHTLTEYVDTGRALVYSGLHRCYILHHCYVYFALFTSRCKAKYVTRSVSIISVGLREKISTKLLIRIFFRAGYARSHGSFAYWEKRSLSYPKRAYSLTQTSVKVKDTWSLNSTNPTCFLECTGTFTFNFVIRAFLDQSVSPSVLLPISSSILDLWFLWRLFSVSYGNVS